MVLSSGERERGGGDVKEKATVLVFGFSDVHLFVRIRMLPYTVIKLLRIEKEKAIARYAGVIEVRECLSGLIGSVRCGWSGLAGRCSCCVVLVRVAKNIMKTLLKREIKCAVGALGEP